MKKSSAYLQWSLVQLFFVISVIFSVMFGIYSPNITSSLNVNPAQFGWLAGVFFIFYAAVQFYSGKLFVNVSPKLILVSSALISATGSLLLALTSSLTLLFIARILLGIGLASTYVGVLYIIQRNFTASEFSVMSSLSQCLANLAGTTFAFCGGMILSTLSYKIFFSILACVFVACALLILMVIKDTDPADLQNSVNSSLFSDLKIILKNTQVWWATLFFTGMFGAILSFANLFATSFQIASFDLTTSAAVSITSMILLGVTIGSIISGVMANRLKNYARTAQIFALISTLAFCAVLYARLDFLPQHLAAMIVYFIFGFGLGGCVMAFQSIQENVIEENLRPLATSFVLTVAYVFVGFIEQPLIGQLLNMIKTQSLMKGSNSTVLLHQQLLINLTVHDQFYKYALGLSLVLVTLILSFIASLFLKRGK